MGRYRHQSTIYNILRDGFFRAVRLTFPTPAPYALSARSLSEERAESGARRGSVAEFVADQTKRSHQKLYLCETESHVFIDSYTLL